MQYAYESLLFAIVPLSIFLFYLWKSLSSRNKGQRRPPSPARFPIIGNLHQMSASPHRFLHSLSEKHGPLMMVHLGSMPALIASTADAAREIMKTHDQSFLNRPKLSIASRLLYDLEDIASAPYGEYWRQVRSLAVLHLLSNTRVRSFRRIREEETQFMIDSIRMLSNSVSVVDLSEKFVSLTNDVVSRVALGKKYREGERGEKFQKLFDDFFGLLRVFNVGDYIPWLNWVNRFNGINARVNRVVREFDTLLEEAVNEHRDLKKRVGGEDGKIVVADGGISQDFVDILLEIENQENPNGFHFHKNTIKAIVLDMFVGGTHTSSTVLEWTTAELLRNPEIMKKLQDEVKEVGKGKSKITEDDLEKMQYLKAVIKESMRLHPPVPLLVPRESTEDVRIMGYDIKAGTQVIVNYWAIGRDPSLWEDPESFRPERFLNSPIDFRGLHFELIPFGAGRRACPGISFGMVITELALANLVFCFDFRLPKEGQVVDMTEAPGLTSRTRSPLLLVATPC